MRMERLDNWFWRWSINMIISLINFQLSRRSLINFQLSRRSLWSLLEFFTSMPTSMLPQHHPLYHLWSCHQSSMGHFRSFLDIGNLPTKHNYQRIFPLPPFHVKKQHHQATPIVNLPKMMEDRMKKEEHMAILNCRLVLAQGLEQLSTGPGHPFHVKKLDHQNRVFICQWSVGSIVEHGTYRCHVGAVAHPVITIPWPEWT